MDDAPGILLDRNVHKGDLVFSGQGQGQGSSVGRGGLQMVAIGNINPGPEKRHPAALDGDIELGYLTDPEVRVALSRRIDGILNRFFPAVFAGADKFDEFIHTVVAHVSSFFVLMALQKV